MWLAERFERGAVADVGAEPQCFAAESFDGRCRFFDLRLAAGGGDDIGAGDGKTERQGATDAGGSAGDDGNPSF